VLREKGELTAIFTSTVAKLRKNGSDFSVSAFELVISVFSMSAFQLFSFS